MRQGLRLSRWRVVRRFREETLKMIPDVLGSEYRREPLSGPLWACCVLPSSVSAWQKVEEGARDPGRSVSGLPARELIGLSPDRKGDRCRSKRGREPCLLP